MSDAAIAIYEGTIKELKRCTYACVELCVYARNWICPISAEEVGLKDQIS